MKTKRSSTCIPTTDRLSCLPDEVIIHVLSFLKTKPSVQTSVLSKRWRYIWAHVPFLQFGGDDDYTYWTVNSKIITEIVLHHKHDLHTFKLDISGRNLDATEEEFESWILNIATRNICNLVMDLDHRFVLPRCIFTCRTLVYLSLAYSKYIPVSGMYFPLLKKLDLRWVRYESHESLAHLISGCPMLDELSIDGELLGQCCVSSPTLTRLDRYLDTDFSNFGLKLDTPALRYLRLYCSMPDEFSVGALDSLIEAHITLDLEEDDQDNLIYSRNVLAFVAKLYNVELLKLSTDRITVINDSLFYGFAIKFNNLTKLDLHVYSNLGFVKSFLENANNLQILCLEIKNMDVIDNQYYWMEPKRVPKCLISHLREVHIRRFGCYEHEFDMVRYILMKAKVLKRMKIRPYLDEQDWKKKFEVVKRLALFERRSKKCQLVFD